MKLLCNVIADECVSLRRKNKAVPSKISSKAVNAHQGNFQDMCLRPGANLEVFGTAPSAFVISNHTFRDIGVFKRRADDQTHRWLY